MRLARATISLAAIITTLTFTAAIAQSPTRSLSLAEALESAVTANPNLAQLDAQRGVAEAKAREAKSGYYPRVDLSGSYSRYDEPNIIVPIHETGVFPPLDDDLYEGLVRLSVPIYNGGRTGSTLRAARAAARETGARGEALSTRLMSDVAAVYIRFDELGDRRGLLAAQLEALGARHREVLLLSESRRVGPGDLARVVAAMERARSDSLEIEFAVRELSNRLGQLVGASEPVLPSAAREPARAELGAGPPSVPESGSALGPDLRAAWAGLDAAEAGRAAAAGAFRPEISGFAAYSLRSGDDLDATGEWALGLRLSLPLFDGGRRKAARNMADAARDAAEARYRAERENQAAELRIASERWRISVSRREHLADAAAAQSVSVTAQSRLYAEGRSSLSDLLTQETELLELRIAERATLSAARLATLDYHATLGALTTARAEAIVRSSP